MLRKFLLGMVGFVLMGHLVVAQSGKSARSYHSGFQDGGDNAALTLGKAVVTPPVPVYTGDSLVLVCRAAGADAALVEYEWRKLDDAAFRTTGGTLKIDTVRRKDAGQYYCQVTNRFNGDHFYADTVTVTVLESRLLLKGVQLSQTALNRCSGEWDSVTLNYTVDTEQCGVRVRQLVAQGKGFVPLFGWQQDGTAVGSDGKYGFKPFALTHNGRYWCEVELKPAQDYITGVQAVSDTCDVVVNDVPVVKITAPLTKIPEGEEVLLQAEGAQSYRWQGGETTDMLRVAPSRTTTYWVKGYNGTACTADAEVTIEVIRLEISAGANVWMSVGRSAVLTAQTNVDDVKWYRLEEAGESKARSAGDPSRVFVSEGKTLTVTPLQTTKYEAEATFCGATSSSFVTVFVKQLRSYHSGFQDGGDNASLTLGLPAVVLPAKVYTGDSAVLVCTGAGADKGVLAYEWRKLGDEQPKRNGDTLTIDTVRLTDAGSYYCLVSNRLTGESTSSDTTALTVLKSRVKIKTLALSVGDIDRCENERDSVRVSYTLHTDSCGVRTRQLVQAGKGFHLDCGWWRKGVLKGQEPLLLFPELTLPDTGFYKAAVTIVPEYDYLWGETRQSDSLHVEVRRYPVVKISAPAAGMMVCRGTELMLDGRSTELGNTNHDVYGYLWSGAGISGAANTVQAKAVPPVTTTYRLTVNNHQCSRFEEVKVEVYVPAIDLPGSYTVTAGDWVTLPVTADPEAMVTWRVGDRQLQEELATVPFTYGPVEGSERIYATASRYGCWATDSCLLMVRSSRAFRSGFQDGHTLGCIVPVIVAVKNTAQECTGEEAAFRVVAEGSDLHYRWERYNEVTFEYEPFVPQHAGITGLEMPELRFASMVFGDEGVYRCVVWNECGEEESVPFSLSLEGAPMLRGSLKKLWEMCEGPGKVDLAVVAVSPNGKPLTYQWFKNGEPVSGATREGYSVTSTQKSSEGLYRVEVRNVCGMMSDSARVMIHQPARVPNDYQKLVTGCAGSRVEFTIQPLGGGSYEVELREVTPLPGGTAEKPLFVIKPGVIGRGVKVVKQVALADNGKTFVWTVKNDCGADTSGLIFLSVEKQPTIASFTRGPLTICAGQPLTLTCTTAEELPEYVYQWYKNDRPVAIGKQFTIAELAPENAGLYRCGVNHKTCVGQVFTDQIEVRIQQPPQVNRTITVTGQDYCLRQPLTLHAKVYDTEPVDSVRWYHDGRPLYDVAGHYAGAATEILAIASIAEGDGGTYRLRAWNRCHYTETDPWSFTVDFPARFVTDLNGYTDLKLCAGDNQVVSVQAEGTAPIMYMWTRNKVKITEGYSNSITLKEVNVDSTGEYCCEIHNKCTDQAVRVCAKINVYAPPLFTLTGDEFYCAGGDEPAKLQLSGSDPACSYLLYRDDEVVMTLRDPAGAPLLFSPVYAGNYHVMAVLDSNDCRRTMLGEVTVRENQAPYPYVLYLKVPYCQGSDGGTLALDETEKSVAYQLYQEVGNQWRLTGSARNGTGGPQLWSGLRAGRYRMEAVNRWTGCTATLLPGIVEIVQMGLPVAGQLRFRENDSLYCVNTKSDVALQVQVEEAGCNYLLLRNDIDTLHPVANVHPAVWQNLKEGTYRMVVRNQWGCGVKGGLRTVKTQALPQRFDFGGSAVYCKGSDGEQLLTLSGSRQGIDYLLYRTPADSVTLVAGTGMALTLSVPAADAKYWMTAKDRTPEQCRDTMNGQVDIQAALLATVGNPAALQVSYQGKATLSLTVSGAVEPVSYAWEPAALVVNPGGKSTETVPLEEGNLFTAMVKDATGCTDTATVLVTVNGGPLRAEIRLADKNTSVDTMRLCANEPLSLYGFRDGGVSGAYQLEWLEGGRVIASGQSLTTYRKKTTGYLYFQVSRDAMGPVRDSVWVALQDTVQVYRLEEDGMNCVAAGKQKLTLSGSDERIKYRLEYSADGRPPFASIDSTVAVAGQSVALESEPEAYGFYRIRGINGKCQLLMKGVAELRQEPALFAVSGSCEYCGGRGADTIYLSGSEKGVTYELYRGRAKIATKTVTQAGPLLFTGAYGAGEYSVQAVLGKCRMIMRNTVLIRVNPLPVASALLGCGAYCDKDLPRYIQVKISEPEVDYTLLRYAVDGATSRSRSATPTDPLEQIPLPPSGYRVEKNGRYEVLATNRLTGCNRLLADTLLVEPTPAPVEITGGGQTCEATGKILTNVKIRPVEAGVKYILCDKWGTSTWNIDQPEGDAYVFTDLLPVGTYQVRAEMGGCSNELSTEIKVERIIFPAEPRIGGAGVRCSSGETYPIALNQSAVGTDYVLEYLAGGVRKEIERIPGWGGVLNFGGQQKPGTYYVVMEKTGCRRQIADTLMLVSIPVQALVLGGESACDLGTGKEVEIRIEGAETGVTYQLNDLRGVIRGTFVPGADPGVQVYRNKLEAGSYVVKAIRGACSVMMNDTVKMIELNNIRDLPLDGAGEYCSTVAPALGMPLTESKVDYTLWWETYGNGAVSLVTKPGGGPVTFGTYTDAGRYYVTAVNAEGCKRQLTGEVRIGKMPEKPEVSGGGAYCASEQGVSLTVKMWPWSEGVAYRLCPTGSQVGPIFGFPHLDTLYYNGLLSEGEYKVVATLGKCQVISDQVVRVEKLPIPSDAPVLVPAGEQCLSGEQEVRLTGAETNIIYRLYRRKEAGDVLVATLENGTFGKVNLAGTYYVKASFPDATGCSRELTSMLRLKAVPASFRVTGGPSSYCEGTPGVTVTVSAVPVESGLTYRLYALSDGRVISNLIDRQENTLSYTGMLTEGNYVVRTERDGCRTEAVDTVKVSKRILRLDNLYKPLSGCEGVPLTIGVEGSQQDVRYELWKEGKPDVQLLVKEGDGLLLGFGNHTERGRYYMVATDLTCGITKSFPDRYTINRAPALFDLTGGGEYCASTVGRTLGLSGSETGVPYRVQRAEREGGNFLDVSGGTYIGDGLPFTFPGRYREGYYRAVADNGCVLPMNHPLYVTSLQEPDTTLRPVVSGACQNGKLQLTFRTENQTVYTLLWDYLTEMGSLTGDGNEQFFTVENAPLGTYAIRAELNGCEALLAGKAEVGKLPMKPELEGDRGICGVGRGTLTLLQRQAGTTYRLRDNNTGKYYTGALESGVLTFKGLPAGAYVAEAARGDCRMESDPWVIKALQPGQIASNVWEANDCVAPGTAVIHLKNLSSLQDYILTGTTLTGGTKRIDGAVGSVDLTQLSPGEYHLQAQNKGNMCLSDTLTLRIREEAFDARLTADTTYCQGDAGARLALQMSGTNMEYAILSPRGEVIEKITSPTMAFQRDYRFGKYILTKLRTGSGGGCKREQPFEVRMTDLPNEKLSLTTGSDGALCFGNTYQVTVQGAEADVKYELLDKDNKVLETRNGTGGDLLFNVPVFQAGYYMVRAERSGCSILLDSVLQLHEVPADITVTAGSYCSAQPGYEEPGGVIGLGGMKQGIHYILTDLFDYPLDTIARPVTVFAPQAAGEYRIKGEDLSTGCSAVLKPATVVRHLSPNVLSVANSCGTSAEVALPDRSESNGVLYKLYCAGVYTGTNLPGNGGRLSFGVKTTPGIYRVEAQASNGCRTWMEDSVWVYLPTGDGRLAVNGELCLPAGVSLAYDRSVAGWYYYVAQGLLCSDTLAGNGGRLAWNRVGDARIQAATYHLMAYNACEHQPGPDTTILPVSLPVNQPVQGGDILCSDAGVDFILANSEADVEYRLERKQPWSVFPTVRGTGGALKLNDRLLKTGGIYTVHARRIGSRCEVVVAQKTFTEGKQPQFLNVIGSNLCTSAGSGAGIELCMAQREQGVDYLLYHIAGVPTERARLSADGSERCFPSQNLPGVYKVVGQDNQSGCRRDMLNLYSIGEKANRYSLENGGQKVNLCPGIDTVIRLQGSDVGVLYQLKLNGVASGNGVAGTGNPITFGRVNRGGKYSVEAFNACGAEGMMDTVTVVENPLPPLQVQDTAIHYCADLLGGEVEIFHPVVGDVYHLLTLDGRVLEVIQGKAGAKQSFLHPVAEGEYLVTATRPATGCVRTDSVQIKRDALPLIHRLYASGGDYICPKALVELRLDGSDRGISYTLYREGESGDLGERSGNGADLLLRKLADPGIYRAEGRDVQTGCRVAMSDTLDLKVAGEIIPYVVTSPKPAYCYTDIAKGTVELSGSSDDVSYTLLQNGKPWGTAVLGTGDIVEWKKVDGRDCALDTGYVYTVLARDVVTACTKLMNNKVAVVEEQDAVVRQFHPNKSLKVCPGELQDFNVVAEGCNLNYNWYRRTDGGTVLIQDPAVTNMSYYQLDPVTMADYGTYWCEVTNRCSEKASAPVPAVQLQFNRPVTQPERMKDYRVCVNDIRPVTLDAGMRGAVKFEWYQLGDEALKYTEELLTVTEYKDGDAYVCRASNDCNVILDTCIIRIDGKPELEILRGDSVALCQGERYQLEVKTTSDFVWQLNGKALPHTASVLTLDPVTTADEGRYTVRLLNGCGDTTLVVGDLLVDQPLHVKEVTPGVHPVVCAGRPITLSVEATPSKRVVYEWYYGTVLLDNPGPLLHIPVVEKSTTLQTYTVYFRNACENYAPDGTRNDFVQIRIELNDSIRYTDPVREVIACADASKEVVLRVGHPVDQLVTYQWSHFNHEADTVTMASQADTIAIPLTSKQNGYYFCRLYNECGAVATRSTWFRVDSIPVPLSGLQSDTLCEGASLKRTLASLGGSMYYAWIQQDKTGKIDTIGRTNKEFFESESELFIPSLTMAHDSIRIWCVLRNGCGTGVTDTMLLRVRPAIRMELTPDTVSVCGLENGGVYLELTEGDVPWSYSYLPPDGQAKLVKATERTDTLWVSVPGDYRVTGFSDEFGCQGKSDLVFTVVTWEIPVAHIYGGGNRCPGDTASIHLQITGGKGPWKIWLADRYSDALPFTSPFELHGRDTVLWLTAMDTASYYVDIIQDTYGGPASGNCPGTSAGKAEIWVHTPDMVDFALLGEPNIGQCRSVKLHKKFRPTLRYAGTPLTDDCFYLNGSAYALAGSELTIERLSKLKGEQTIVYRDTNEYGCLVTSSEVSLFVDTLPSVTLDAGDGHACGNVLTSYQIALSGAPKFTLELERRIIKYSRFHRDEQYTRWTPVLGAEDFIYRGEQMWREADSCMILKVLAVTDRHDCRVTSPETLLPADTVYHHLNPELELWTRYPNVKKTGWSKGMSPVYVSRGDSAGVKVILTVGDRPWNMVCSPRGSISGIHGADTVFALDTGRYRVTAEHEYCDIPGSFGEVLDVCYRDTGYLKMKVLLDGPFDLTSGRMHRDPKVVLPLYGIQALPDLSKVPDREIIDWIEVELRNGNNKDSIARMGQGSLLITRDTCLVWSDGTVTDRLGDTVIALPGGAAPGYNNYYVVVHHRNHLAVMSRTYYAISRTHNGRIPMVDFRKTGSIYISGDKQERQKLHMSELSGGNGVIFWALSAGDMNSNALVSVFDPNRMNLEKLSPEVPGLPIVDGYDLFDVNFDGSVDWPGWGNTSSNNTLDWDKVRRNRSKFTEVRFE